MGYRTAALVNLASGAFSLFSGLRAAPSEGISPLFQRLAGAEALTASRAEAAALGEQARIALEESLRAAAKKEREAKAFEEEQAVAFASGGIRLAGSPLGILEETRLLSQQEIDAIRRAGMAQARLSNQRALQALRAGYAAKFTAEAQALQNSFAFKQQQRLARQMALSSGLKGFGAIPQLLPNMPSSSTTLAPLAGYPLSYPTFP